MCVTSIRDNQWLLFIPASIGFAGFIGILKMEWPLYLAERNHAIAKLSPPGQSPGQALDKNDDPSLD